MATSFESLDRRPSLLTASAILIDSNFSTTFSYMTLSASFSISFFLLQTSPFPPLCQPKVHLILPTLALSASLFMGVRPLGLSVEPFLIPLT